MSKKKSFILVASVMFACSSTNPASPPGPGVDAGDGSTPNVTPDPGGSPDGGQAQVEPDPTNPKDDANHDLGWAPAPLMQGVTVAANRDSAIVVVPAFGGAVDYRVATLPDGVNVTVQDGAERIDGSTIHCAGYRQHNAPQPSNRELLQQIEVTGLGGATRLVVEAIDTACPYTGALGASHVDVDATTTAIDGPTRGTLDRKRVVSGKV